MEDIDGICEELDSNVDLNFDELNYDECFDGSDNQACELSQQNAAELRSVLSVMRFGAESIRNDDEKVKFYTGLPTYKVFETIFKILEPYAGKQIVPSCPLVDEYFATLAKLRLELLSKDAAYRVGVYESDFSKMFHKWLNVMYSELKQLIIWPDHETLRQNLPLCFRKHYSKVVCKIDCFEIFIERPVSLQARAATYSQYKKHNTVKVLIGITPTRSISKAWGGHVSDKVITQVFLIVSVMEMLY